jgi:hypothetical protein
LYVPVSVQTASPDHQLKARHMLLAESEATVRSEPAHMPRIDS